MTSDPVAIPATRRRRGRRLLRIVGVLVAGVLVCIALLAAFPPVGLLKDRLAQHAGAALGRTVTIGSADLAYWPTPSLRLEKISVASPDGPAAEPLLTTDSVEASIEMSSLLRGRTDLATVRLIGPVLNLREDGDGAKNWDFEASETGGTMALRLPRSAAFENGRVTYRSAKTGSQTGVESVTGTVGLDDDDKTVRSKGSFRFHDENITYDATLADAGAATDGKATDLKATLDGRHGKVRLAGQVIVPVAGPSAIAGDLDASSSSALDLARWLGADIAPTGEPLRTSISGKVKLTPRNVTFAGALITINTTSGYLDGHLSLAGPRPRLEGLITTERIDVARITGTARRLRIRPQATAAPAAPSAAPGDGEIEFRPAWTQLLDDLAALERPAAQGAAPTSASAQPSALATSPWSDRPLSLSGLKVLDLDVTVKANEIVYGGLDLKNGRIKTKLSDGQLEANLDALDVGKGKAKGTLKLNARAEPPVAALELNLTDVAAEPIITELTGKPLLSGLSNVDISAMASGQTQRDFASTLQGRAKFRMGRGAIRGFDVRRMISEWWHGWKFNLARKTRFERLIAQYDIKKGVAKNSRDFELGGSEVEISSTGQVNVAKKRLNQEIRIKVVPPPTALPIPVRISGAWSKPSVGIDWGGLFSSSGGLGGPQGVTPTPEPAPLAVQAAIRRVLAADVSPDRLTADGRALLRSLLPAEPVSEPAAASQPTNEAPPQPANEAPPQSQPESGGN
jgi:AsmA protein